MVSKQKSVKIWGQEVVPSVFSFHLVPLYVTRMHMHTNWYQLVCIYYICIHIYVCMYVHTCTCTYMYVCQDLRDLQLPQPPGKGSRRTVRQRKVPTPWHTPDANVEQKVLLRWEKSDTFCGSGSMTRIAAPRDERPSLSRPKRNASRQQLMMIDDLVFERNQPFDRKLRKPGALL